MQPVRSELYALALRRAKERAQQQAVMLYAVLIACLVVLMPEVACIKWLPQVPSQPISAPEVLPAKDIPLLTPEQREEARRSGVAAYELNGIWHVDHRVPQEYWEEWIG